MPGSIDTNIIHQYKGGASPRRVDARLGSTHARRNGRGCRQIGAENATVVLPRGT